jgi:hypothetical protein
LEFLRVADIGIDGIEPLMLSDNPQGDIPQDFKEFIIQKAKEKEVFDLWTLHTKYNSQNVPVVDKVRFKLSYEESQGT